jgi:Fe-S cluster assembly iron-binding protein IscA
LLAINGRAKEELEKIHSKKMDNPQVVLRLIVSRPGEFGLGMDVETPNDHVVEHNGSKILIVDQELAESLEEYTLAFEDKQFVMAKGPLSGFNKSVVPLDEKERK